MERRRITINEREDDERDATDRQLDYIKALMARNSETQQLNFDLEALGRRQASDLIEALVEIDEDRKRSRRIEDDKPKGWQSFWAVFWVVVIGFVLIYFG